MIPSNFEYLTILSFLMLLLVALFGPRARHYLTQRHYLAGLLMFFVFSFILEIVALSQHWWAFDKEKITGASIAGVPCEEMILFLGFYFIVVVGWEDLAHDVD